MDTSKNNSSRPFLSWFCERVLFYVHSGKLPSWPWRYRSLLLNYRENVLKPLRIFKQSLGENPIRTIRFCHKFFFQKSGFILLVFGPKVLRDALAVCESLEIKPFLLFGTLRGYLLRRDFLSKVCSGDMDFGLLEADYHKAALIKEEMCKKGYVFCQDNGYELLFHHPDFPSLMIDFFRVYKKDQSVVITTGINKEKKEKYSHYLPLDIFPGFQQKVFHKVKVLIPSDSERFLLLHYGKEWNNDGRKFEYLHDNKHLKIENI